MKRFYISLVMAFTLNLVVAQQKVEDTKPTIESRVTNLESLESQRDKSIELKKEELSGDIKDELEIAKDEIKDSLGFLSKYGIAAIVLSALGMIISGIFTVNVKFKKWIEALSSGKIQAFNDAIKAQEFETKVRNQKNITVISVDAERATELQLLMRNLGFKDHQKTNYKTISTYEEIPPCDLVILNDIEKNFTGSQKELFLNLLEKSVKTQVFLAYTTGQGHIPTHERMNLANSQFTLFQQILNTIKVGELIKQNQD